jgi:threonine dehydrogenase-like Zn-dependent dehydrogenase
MVPVPAGRGRAGVTKVGVALRPSERAWEGLTIGDRVAALTYCAHAEYDLAESTAVVPLPASLDGVPMPGEPLGCAVNIFQRSGIEAGQTVAIVGIGFLGALLTRLAAQAGARVIAISRRPFALDVARQAGAQHTVIMDDHWRILDEVKRLTDGRWCERVIEAVGLQWPLDLRRNSPASAAGSSWRGITRTACVR